MEFIEFYSYLKKKEANTTCIIMVKRKEHTFVPKLVERMYDMGNRDGAGMMWVEDGRVKTLKTMGSYKEIMDLYAKEMHRDMALHLRNASYGMEKNIENAHPFCVLSKDLGHKMDLYMMHNGRFNDILVEKKMSDSYNFATVYLRGLLAAHPNLIYDETFQFMLAGLISPNNNKLVFLDNKYNFIFINKDLGMIHPTGVWVSTKSEIKEFTYQSSTTTHTNYGPVNTVKTTTTTTPSKLKNGTWEDDADGRLHFVPNLVPEAESNAEDASTTDDQTEDTTDSGTSKEIVDQDALAEFLAKIPDMKRAEVFNLVKDFPYQTIAILCQLSKEKPSKIKKIVRKLPWEAADKLMALANKELNANTEQQAV